MRDVHGATVRSFDGLRIVYDARGRGEPAIVFIHGWCCNRRQWDAQMDRFSRDHRVVALDLGGHGDSGRSRSNWSMPILARDVQAVVEDQDLKQVILVGHSMGGPVALMAAARMPDRVVGVIGVDTLHDAETVYTKDMLGPYMDALEKDFAGSARAMVRGVFPKDPPPDPALVERITNDTLACDPKIAVALMRSYLDYDGKATLAACGAPVRCINAAMTGETKIRVNRKYAPGFDAVILNGVGHFIMLQEPEDFNPLLARQIDAVLSHADK